MSTAARLRAAAVAVRAASAEAAATHSRLRLADAALGTHAADALAAGVAVLGGTAPPWAATADRMRAVALVLEQAAGLHEILELFDGRLGALLNVLGDVIDHRCAEAVTALCTPAARPPQRRLGDVGDLGLEAVHELNLTEHPELEELLAGKPPARLLEVGSGIAAVVGDVDAAEQVVTFVAGVGSADPAQWPGYLDRARTLHRATGAATVMWLNYHPPENLAAAVAHEPARRAAGPLRQFQRDLAGRNPGQRRIVVGHSYGSVVAAEAAGRGLSAHEVVLVGSPGSPVPPSDFRLLPGGRVHAITSAADPIGATTGPLDGAHGPDPAAPRSGARRWPTGPQVGHSDYWEDPATLEALATIVRQPS